MNFSGQIKKKTRMWIIKKIRPVGVEPFLAER